MISDKTALVTGGAGFIGSNLVEALLERNYTVRVLDNFSTGHRKNIEPFLEDIILIEGDLRSYERVHKSVKGTEIVFHVGALPSVPRSVQDPITSNAANVDGTLNVLLASRDEGVKRVVFASSSSIYGNTEVLPKVETLPQNPMSPYAVAKLAGESYCRSFASIFDIETVSLRYFNIFGPRQDPNSQYSAVIPKFINMMKNGESLTVFGDGNQSRDFTFVQNAVEATILASQADNVSGEVFNVGCGDRTTLNQLMSYIEDILGVKAKIEYLPPRSGDVAHSLADINKAIKLLNYEPKFSIKDGLVKTCEWFGSKKVEPVLAGN